MIKNVAFFTDQPDKKIPLDELDYASNYCYPGEKLRKWVKTPEGQEFTGLVEVASLSGGRLDYRTNTYSNRQECRSQYWLLHGKIHNIHGPAVVEQYWGNGTSYGQYCLNGQKLTKKAWASAVSSIGKDGDVNDYSFLEAKYTFTGSFESEEFGFKGFDGVLVAVRVGRQWLILNKASRTTGRLTKYINKVIKGCPEPPVEVSQRELENLLVETMPQVLR